MQFIEVTPSLRDASFQSDVEPTGRDMEVSFVCSSCRARLIPHSLRILIFYEWKSLRFMLCPCTSPLIRLIIAMLPFAGHHKLSINRYSNSVLVVGHNRIAIFFPRYSV